MIDSSRRLWIRLRTARKDHATIDQRLSTMTGHLPISTGKKTACFNNPAFIDPIRPPHADHA